MIIYFIIKLRFKIMKKYFPLKFSLILPCHLIIMCLSLNTARAVEITPKQKYYEKIFSELDYKIYKGKKILANDLKDKIVLLNFWASWCSPCLEEIPSMVKLRKKFSDKKLKIIAINSDEGGFKKKIKKFLRKYSVNFDVVLDPVGTITNKFMVSEIPESILFYKGKVIHFSSGETDFMSAQFIEKIKKLH